MDDFLVAGVDDAVFWNAQNRLEEFVMQDAIGIGVLLGTAVLFRLCFHSTTGLAFQSHAVIRVVPFSVITFWALSLVAGFWLLTAAVGFVVRLH